MFFFYNSLALLLLHWGSSCMGGRKMGRQGNRSTHAKKKFLKNHMYASHD